MDTFPTQNQTITAFALKQVCNGYIHVKFASGIPVAIGNKQFFLRSCVNKYSDSFGCVVFS